jgi:hypothetical protein
MLELRRDNMLRRIQVRYNPSVPEQAPRVVSQELVVTGKLMYRVMYGHMQEISHYRMPLLVEIENPEKKMQLTVQYNDLDVNTLISDDSFILTDETGTSSGS